MNNDTNISEDCHYPRLMVISGHLPDFYGGGAKILRSLLDDYPAEKLCWCTLIRQTRGRLWWRNNVPKFIIPLRFYGRSFPLVNWFISRFLYRIEGYIAAWYALKVSRKFRPQLCWVILDFDTIFSAEVFLRKCRLPVHASVHDDPVIAARLWNYHTPIAEVEKAFSFCITHAKSLDCISRRMAERYKLLYKREAMVLTRGVDCSKGYFMENKTVAMESKIKIIMAGCSELPDPWLKNVSSVLEILRYSHGLTVELYVFGRKTYNLGERIYQMQFMHDNEFDKFMQGMDIGFSFNPLTETAMAFAASSFPTKIVTYIGYGIPFLYSGPVNSTVGDLLHCYKAGLIVEGIDSAQIADGFLTIINNYQAMRQECFRAARECFEINVLKRKIISRLIEVASI